MGEDNWSHPSPHVLPQNMDVKTEGKEGPTTYLLAEGYRKREAWTDRIRFYIWPFSSFRAILGSQN